MDPNHTSNDIHSNRAYTNYQNLLTHIYRTRRIYSNILENIQREDRMIEQLLTITTPNQINPFYIEGVGAGDNRQIHTPNNIQTRTTNSINTFNTVPNNQYTAHPHTPHNVFSQHSPSSNNTMNNIHPERAGRFYTNSQRNNIINRSVANPNGEGVGIRPQVHTFFMDITDIILRNMNNSNNQNVGLTEQEINDVCRYCTFNELPIMIRNRYTTCPITLDDFNDDSQVSIIRNCGHVFSRPALNNWLTRHSTCPSCRRNVRRQDDNDIHHTNDTSNNQISYQSNNTMNNNNNNEVDENSPSEMESDNEDVETTENPQTEMNTPNVDETNNNPNIASSHISRSAVFNFNDFINNNQNTINDINEQQLFMNILNQLISNPPMVVNDLSNENINITTHFEFRDISGGF